MLEYTKFKGITQIGNSTVCEQLKANLTTFYNWGMLEIGGFTNVSIPESGAFGGNFHKLRLVEDPNYTKGRVWETARQKLVYESGMDYAYSPIQISGVYVNNTFYPITGTGTYEHKISYPLGRVIFTSAIPATSTVYMEYSFKYANFYTSDVPWFKEVMFNSYRVDDPNFLQYGSGVWSTLGQNRVQLPAVIVETVPRRDFIPLQIGGGQWLRQDVLFHILAENTWDRDKLIDIITYQNDRTILSFDKNLVATADKFPLDYEGSLRSGAMIYPDLIKSSGEGGFFWKKIFIKDMRTQEALSVSPLFRAVVRGTFEIDFPEI